MLKLYWRRIQGQDSVTPHSVVRNGLLLHLQTPTFAASRLLPLRIAIWVWPVVPLMLTAQVLPQLTGMVLVIGSGLLLIGLFDSETETSLKFGSINNRSRAETELRLAGEELSLFSRRSSPGVALNSAARSSSKRVERKPAKEPRVIIHLPESKNISTR